MMSHMYMYKNTDTYEYLIYFLHEFISFKDMLSYNIKNLITMFIYINQRRRIILSHYFLLTIMMKSDLFVSYPYLY